MKNTTLRLNISIADKVPCLEHVLGYATWWGALSFLGKECVCVSVQTKLCQPCPPKVGA